MKKMGWKIVWFFTFLVLGFLVFVVFSHMRPWFAGTWDWVGRILLFLGLFASGFFLRKTNHWKDTGSVLWAFGIALASISVDLYLPSTSWWLSLLGISLNTPAGIAIDKLDSTLIILAITIALTRLSGFSLGSIFLQKGKLRKGLIIGTISFTVCAVGSFFMAQAFGAVNLTLARLVPWIPWILLFIAGNALNEELLFRGLFLNKMKPVLGPLLTNLVLILPFVLHHTGVTYTNDALMFLAYLIPLAFFWGWISQKTDSLWGSFLFHAGTDISVILVIFSQM